MCFRIKRFSQGPNHGNICKETSAPAQAANLSLFLFHDNQWQHQQDFAAVHRQAQQQMTTLQTAQGSCLFPSAVSATHGVMPITKRSGPAFKGDLADHEKVLPPRFQYQHGNVKDEGENSVRLPHDCFGPYHTYKDHEEIEPLPLPTPSFLPISPLTEEEKDDISQEIIRTFLIYR